jgi:serine/threonine protein kinase
MNNTIISMVRGLYELHSRGIIHRDLIPSNVLFTKEGLAKIGDVGNARAVDGDVTERTSGRTLFHSSPELFDDQSASEASDVWALGITV